jgi:glycosyltransferase involved in cell wall biosynthesis
MKGRDMRIAMIAPLMESVPPPLYGGTERVVSVLSETLVRRGHQVTLFASGDSVTHAKLVPCCRHALRLDTEVRDPLAFTVAQLGEVYQQAASFDIIHNHNDYYAFPAARMARTPTVTTTHGRLDLPEYRRVYQAFREQPLVSISHAQRAPVPDANWVSTVYNGIEINNYHYRSEPGDYLLFLGRISPEKRPDRAIEIARDVGMRLIIAAKVDATDRDYYEHAIKKQIASSSLIEFVGEVNEQEKDALLGGAYAYLFPIDWPEPFGLTMVEAMATGTPVIATSVGSVEEIVVDGVTGFLCRSFHDMVEAVERVGSIDRHTCRAHVERHFSPDVMAAGYESVYRRLVNPIVVLNTDVVSAPVAQVAGDTA